ncbi:MAG: hypothetical protein FWF88_04640 [Peptococcaceae bacterium]|nr:hypothetical protein [Peptococcaceae bacterium]
MDKADILQPVDQQYQVNSINEVMLDTLTADNCHSIGKRRQMRFFTICLFSFIFTKAGSARKWLILILD